MRHIKIKLSEDEKLQLSREAESVGSLLRKPRLGDTLRRRTLLKLNRIRILQRVASDPNVSTDTLAKELDSSKAQICRLLHLFNECGLACIEPKQRGVKEDELGRAAIITVLRQLRRDHPHETPAQLRERLNEHEEIDRTLSLSRVRYYLREAGIRFRRTSSEKTVPRID